MPPGWLLLWIQSGGLWWWLGSGLLGTTPPFLALTSHQVYSVGNKALSSTLTSPQRQPGAWVWRGELVPSSQNVVCNRQCAPKVWLTGLCCVGSGARPMHQPRTVAAPASTGGAAPPVKGNTQAWLKCMQNTPAEENKAVSVVFPPLICFKHWVTFFFFFLPWFY